MRLRWLALYPILYAVAFVAAALWLAAGDHAESLATFLLGQRILVRILGFAGCLAAVSAFEPGDRLRRAWFWLGACTFILLVRDLLRLVPGFVASPAADDILTGLGVLSNFALLAGIWMLARSWKMMVIEMSRPGIAAVVVVSAVVALAVAGPGALEAAREVAEGDWGFLILLVSALVDIVTLCLITPLLLTAVALRGGSFSWPWGLLTASRIAWLLYDAAEAFGATLGSAGFPLPELFRGLGENFLCAAGLAQLLVVRHVRRMARGRGAPAES